MKLTIPMRSLFLITILYVTACASTQQPQTLNVEAIKCPALRPEMCTMDYLPVCGILSEGSFQTYSNGCNACADLKVTSYSQGECK